MKLINLVLVAFLLMVENVLANDLVHTSDMELIYTQEYIKSIFTRRMTHWVTGERITVYTKPLNSIEHRNFLITWVGISAYRFKQLLNRQIYSGKNTSVKVVNSDVEMLLSLRATPHSIGYMSDASIICHIDKNDDLVIIYYE